MPRWASSTTPLKVKKPLSALTWGGRSPQRCSTASTVGTSAALSVGACVTRCSTIRWSSLTATVTVYPSVKPLRSRKKRLSGSVSEARVLQPAGDLLQPLLERRDVLGRKLLAGSFVRIVAVAL